MMDNPTDYYPFTRRVNMSPEAIERRLRRVWELSALCRHLAKAKPVSRIAEKPDDYRAEEKPPPPSDA